MKGFKKVLMVMAGILATLCLGVGVIFAQEVIKVGAVYPLTGALQATGKELKNAIELSAEIANGKHPDLAPLVLADAKGIRIMKDGKLIPATVEIEWGNKEGKIETGAAEVTRLVRSRGVVAILGCWQSAVTRAAATSAAREQVPILTQSVAPELTDPKVMGEALAWFFRPNPSTFDLTELFYRFLVDATAKTKVKTETIALMFENTLYGKQQSDVAKGMAETKYKQFKVVASVGYTHETSDVIAEVLTLKRANPDVVYGMPYISDAILFTKTFREVGFNPKSGYFFDDAGVVEPQYLDTVGKEAEGFLSRGIYNADLRTRKPSLGKIEDLYHKRYGTTMTDNSARSMLKALVLFEAINRAKSAKPDDIRKALLETDIPEAKTNMVYGVKFDPSTHQNVRTQGVGIVQQVRNKVYRVVYPFDFASVDLVWPVPTWDQKK